MKKTPTPVIAVEETWSIPTYPSPEAEEMPMFAETRIHQGTSGNPYPSRVVTKVDREHRAERNYTVIRLENEYIRVAVIPELGGRVFEAYDKVTGYDFLYRQHVIKPALIGAYGSWISGGIEFNWPYHHRPSTMMPVDYRIEREEDGSAIVWLSEHEPVERTKGMVGIVLRPDASYFETRVSVTNRTAYARSFLWWENAAVAVHEGYRLVFPPDVTWVHHHYDRSHTTFPIASGQYGADNITEPKDISWHKNSRLATSYFAAPSRFDFFGGFDYRKNCGVLHIADHHISPGKKMFTWGYGDNAENWEKQLTDADGPYAELMAGSYTDDQPDFTWIAPYETKTFSQYWYPTQGIGYTTCAGLHAAASLDREAGELRVNATSVYEGAEVILRRADGRVLLQERTDLAPSVCRSFAVTYPAEEKLTCEIRDSEGRVLLSYTEEDYDYIHIPKDNPGIPLPDKLITAGQMTVAGRHIDQYRDPLYKPDIYYLAALERDPDYLPALTALGEYYCRLARFADALPYLEHAHRIECTYNPNPADGTVGCLLGYALYGLGRVDEAYDILQHACWSANAISPAMTLIAAIDGQRGQYGEMLRHALRAMEKEASHPLAVSYAALALWKTGETRQAQSLLRTALTADPMLHIARYSLVLITGRGRQEFLDSLHSNPAETALDIAFDLLRAGFTEETARLLEGVHRLCPDSAMVAYTLAFCYEKQGESPRAARMRRAASAEKIVKVFPSRAEEIAVLEDALRHNEKDGFAAYLLGCILYDRRLSERAAELWETAVRYLPDFYIPYRNLAIAYFNRLGRKQEALRLMNRAVELHPGDETLLCETAVVMEKMGLDGKERAAYLEANRPAEASDAMMLAIANSYNAARDYENAERVMLSHDFYPGEGAEFATVEPYLFSRFTAGRIAMREKRYEDALAAFRASRKIPENLHTGFWNESVLMPYRYYEAAALSALGRKEEADGIIRELSQLKNAGMWNMGAEFTYYSALTARLAGDEMRAQRIMREAILAWEAELSDGCRYYNTGVSGYDCFFADPVVARRAALLGMLGYGKLYNKDPEGARALFTQSLALDPSNSKISLELWLLSE